MYIRYFVFIDDVESGEMGYVFSIFEVVLLYFDWEFGGLRRVSCRNKVLWDVVLKGDMLELRKILELIEDVIEDEDDYGFLCWWR